MIILALAFIITSSFAELLPDHTGISTTHVGKPSIGDIGKVSMRSVSVKRPVYVVVELRFNSNGKFHLIFSQNSVKVKYILFR